MGLYLNPNADAPDGCAGPVYAFRLTNLEPGIGYRVRVSNVTGGGDYRTRCRSKADSAFYTDELDGLLEEGLGITGTGLFKEETDDMRYLQSLYRQERGDSIDNTAAYIFILPKASVDGVKGDMPLTRPVGYVFASGDTYADGQTIAHELGHGLYSFQHAFDYMGVSQGETDNLMDYGLPQGEHLAVWQWNLISTHKNYTVPFLTDDEDGWAKYSPICLEVDGTIVQNGEKFYTPLLAQDIVIKVMKNETDTTSLDLDNMTYEWDVRKKEKKYTFEGSGKNATINFSEEGNAEISVKLKESSTNKGKEKTYECTINLYAVNPVVNITLNKKDRKAYESNNNDTGKRFFYDESFKKMIKHKNFCSQYSSFKNYKGDTIYTPVLGVEKDSVFVMNLEIKNGEKLDSTYCILIKSNNKKLLCAVDTSFKDTLKLAFGEKIIPFKIKAEDELTPESLIKVYLIKKATGQEIRQLGELEVVSHVLKERIVNLIYVTFKGEKKSREKLNKDWYQDYINKFYFNQLHYNIKFEQKEFLSSHTRDSFTLDSSCKCHTDSSVQKFFSAKLNSLIKEYNTYIADDNDVFFIIDLEAPFVYKEELFYYKKGYEDSEIVNGNAHSQPAFHKIGEKGGLLLKGKYMERDKDNNWKIDSLSPTLEAETIAHELGHWLGLYHTFDNYTKPNSPYKIYDIGANESIKNEVPNLMDYQRNGAMLKDRRNKWFKYQYNKVHEKTENEVK